jgi:hypothetical protein
MNSHKVTMYNGDSAKEFETNKANSLAHAAFLAGADYAAGLVLMAHAVGALDLMLGIAGPEEAISSLLGVAELETITVENL